MTLKPSSTSIFSYTTLLTLSILQSIYYNPNAYIDPPTESILSVLSLMEIYIVNQKFNVIHIISIALSIFHIV